MGNPINDRFYIIECWIKDLLEKTNAMFVLPSGGQEGNVLVKQGDGIAWTEFEGGGGDIVRIPVSITANEQTDFLSVVPEGRDLVDFFIDGIPQMRGTDYSYNNRSVYWSPSAGIKLYTRMNLSLTHKPL